MTKRIPTQGVDGPRVEADNMTMRSLLRRLGAWLRADERWAGEAEGALEAARRSALFHP
jgi:hypothetical protein